MADRPSWDDTFLAIAEIVSQRATCSRRKVGAVVVRGNRIISTGYNGAPSGRPHCIDGGCPRGKFTHDELPKDADYNQYPCVALHAEANAILMYGLGGSSGATLYVTEKPCQQCWNLIQAAEIRRVVVMGTPNEDPEHPGEVIWTDTQSEPTGPQEKDDE